MEDVNWNYPTVKNSALERYDKEFVLDHAPRCYAATKDLDSFYRMMDAGYASSKLSEKRLYYREQLIDVLNLKIRLLQLRNLMESKISKQQYEEAAELKDEFVHHIITANILKSELEQKRNESDNETIVKLISYIINEIDHLDEFGKL
jgi:glutamyl/glutaminyl-tRNA synthetase